MARISITYQEDTDVLDKIESLKEKERLDRADIIRRATREYVEKKGKK